MPRLLPRAAALAAASAAALAAVPVAAAQFTSLDLIDAQVAAFTGAGIGLPGGAILPVDRRLRLAPCLSPLALTWRSERHDAVVVQCPDPGSWRVFVPVIATQATPSTPAVLRGEALSVVVSGDGFSVSQPGEALESGAVGAWIRIRTVRDGSARGEPVRARIVRPGLAEIPAP